MNDSIIKLKFEDEMTNKNVKNDRPYPNLLLIRSEGLYCFEVNYGNIIEPISQEKSKIENER